LRIPIELSQLGYDMETGRIVGWLREVGDTVARGDAIVEIETEKATVEMEALAAGTLVEVVQPAGSDVPVGGIIGWLDDGA
jgi:pyruvate/2-oxoglutarate dehydrogenase complex dihydrolipoamide acyltransferase (E2) component